MSRAVEGGCETWDRFVKKDHSLDDIPKEYLLAFPGCNDYVEGYHGTFSQLFSTLGALTSVDPSRVAVLAMFRHNIATVVELGFSFRDVTPELWRAAVEYGKLFKENNFDAQARVHKTATKQTR